MNKSFNVICFSSTAGGLGLSYNNVDHIFLMEMAWNKDKLDQYAGRGIRYKCMQGVRKDDQWVVIHSLIATNPNDDEKKTADEHLMQISQVKNDSTTQFKEALQKYTISK